MCYVRISTSNARILSHAYKTGCWYLLGVLFKISDEHPRLFYMGIVHFLYTSPMVYMQTKLKVMSGYQSPEK